jgi:predicted TIM-barrel fold metal-dependent hydrolase
MQTVDIHVHLLNSKVAFDRFYDKVAITFFGKKLGVDPAKLIANPYETYTSSLTDMIRNSEHINQIALFGVDARVDEKGNVLHQDLTVCGTNDELLDLYHKNKDVVIPFFSINPMRPDALDLIDKYVEHGFKGAKFLQNYWNIDTREDRYRPYFEKLKKYDLPLIVHIGSESSVHSYKACEGINMLDHPLAVGVNVIAAHMALDYEPLHIFKTLSKNPKNFNEDYFTLLQMLEQHDNLYADVSALLTPVRAKVLPHLSQQTQIHDKLLFGTDYPVPFSTIFTSYDLPWKKRFELERTQNPFDRYTKAILEYFDQTNPIYTNYTKILHDR